MLLLLAFVTFVGFVLFVFLRTVIAVEPAVQPGLLHFKTTHNNSVGKISLVVSRVRLCAFHILVSCIFGPRSLGVVHIGIRPLFFCRYAS